MEVVHLTFDKNKFKKFKEIFLGRKRRKYVLRGWVFKLLFREFNASLIVFVKDFLCWLDFGHGQLTNFHFIL